MQEKKKERKAGVSRTGKGKLLFLQESQQHLLSQNEDHFHLLKNPACPIKAFRVASQPHVGVLQPVLVTLQVNTPSPRIAQAAE